MQNNFMKKIISLLILTIFSLSLFADKVSIKIFLANGQIVEKEINSNIRLLQINENFFSESQIPNDFIIVNIEGLEELQNLQVLQINDVNNIDDFSFLSKLNFLQELYISSTFVKSLKFLEGMQNLDIIDLTLYVMKEDYKSFKDEIINLEKLLFLKKINFHISCVLDEKNLMDFNDIPKFINVQNQPILNIGKNQIYTISADQKKYLYQYSQIYLWPNPIIDDRLQLQNLRDLNVILK